MARSSIPLFQDTLISIKTLMKGGIIIKNVEDEEKQRRAIVMNFTVLLSLTIALVWFVFEITFRQRLIPLLAQIAGIVGGIFFLWWQRKAKFETVSSVFVALFSVIIISLTILLNLSDPAVFWLFLIPAISFFIGGQKNGIFWSLTVLILFSTFAIMAYYGYFTVKPSVIFIIDFVTAFSLVSIFVFFYERTRQTVQGNLSTSFNRDQTILNTIQDGIILVDQNYQIQLFSLGAQRIFKWNESELLSTPIVNLINIDTTKITNNTNLFDVISAKSKTGDTVFVSLIISPIVFSQNENNQSQYFIITVRDITEEQELKQMKLDFVSIAAHELRTPITSIKGYTHIIETEALKYLPKEYQAFLLRIKASTDQLSILTENLLSVSKIERGSYNVKIIPTNWSDLVQNCVNDLTQSAVQRGLTISFNQNNNLPKVLIDPLRIIEVLNNLISNAINYTKHGTVTITIEQIDQMVVTHIADTGEGIPRYALSHLFEKFFRVSGVLEQGSKGTGLGLYISKSIVELHGGKIWAESTEGKGSTFSFSLPIEQNSSN